MSNVRGGKGATAIAVAIGLVGGALLVGLTIAVAAAPRGGPWCACPLYGSPDIVLSGPKEAQADGSFWYNFSVESAGGGLLLSDLIFQVSVPSGQTFHLTSASVEVRSLYHQLLDRYFFANNSWSSGGGVAVSSTQTFDLQSPTSLSDLGASLVVSQPLANDQTLTLPIP